MYQILTFEYQLYLPFVVIALFTLGGIALVFKKSSEYVIISLCFAALITVQLYFPGIYYFGALVASFVVIWGVTEYVKQIIDDERRRSLATITAILFLLGILATGAAAMYRQQATPGDFIDAFITKRDALKSDLPRLEKNSNSYAGSTAYTKASQRADSILPEAYSKICRDPDIEKFSNEEVLPSSLVGTGKIHFGPTRAMTCMNGYVATIGKYTLGTCWDLNVDTNSCIATYAEIFDNTGAFCEAQQLGEVGATGIFRDKVVEHVSQCREAFQKAFGKSSVGSDKFAGYDPRSPQGRLICGKSFTAQAYFGVTVDRVLPASKLISLITGPHDGRELTWQGEGPTVFTKDCKEKPFSKLDLKAQMDVYASYNTPLTALFIQENQNASGDVQAAPVTIKDPNQDYLVCGTKFHGQLAADQEIKRVEHFGPVDSPDDSLVTQSDSFPINMNASKDSGLAFDHLDYKYASVIYDKTCNKIIFTQLKVGDVVDIYLKAADVVWTDDMFHHVAHPQIVKIK